MVEQFLSRKQYPEEGILQRFIQPKGENNCNKIIVEFNVTLAFLATIRVVWGKEVSLYEKITSLKPINDKRFDIYERAFTVEGKDYHREIRIVLKLPVNL